MSPAPVYSNPTTLGPPVASYSHVSRVGDLIHLAGQTGRDRTGTIPQGITAQVEQALENVRLALDSQGSGLGRVLKLTVYLTDRRHIPDFEAALERTLRPHCADGYPPSTLLLVAGLASPAMLVEIDAVAHA